MTAIEPAVDVAGAERRRRHLAAFMGDCAQVTCEVCHPAPDPWASLTAAEADAMAYRAFREAARCWQDVRSCQDPDLRAVLAEAAASADLFYEAVRQVARDKWAAVAGVDA